MLLHSANRQKLSKTYTYQLRSSSPKLYTVLERRNPAAELHKARRISIIRRSPSGEPNPAPPRRRTVGATLSDSAAKAHALEGPTTREHSNRKVAYHRRSGGRFLSTSLSRANLLVWYARRSVDQASDWDHSKPLFMDVILDLKLRYNGGVLNQLLQRLYSHEMARPSNVRSYAFRDRQSLDIYWADQAVIWHGIGMIKGETLISRFPDSNERFTASWKNTS